ncbi:hypothetical protein [Heliophilum fasciatum]|uniref:Coat F domain-containing protein n=1 Tax=Heliophilum fasciatum TaxID=35700 RepID=A0A4R2RKF2_9FIRM|nr:hypothetical protein [Heliophilum fasciatum]MCW2278008.1 hypothetical protein [Heliophilum fasciatum]TCP64372.1 hypothetical protein EDD73_11071 [Heliophilum fasciatum]
MRKLTESEVLSMRELLQMETNTLIQARAMQSLINDDELRRLNEAAILQTEGTIKSMQQFINENNIIDVGQVN